MHHHPHLQHLKFFRVLVNGSDVGLELLVVHVKRVRVRLPARILQAAAAAAAAVHDTTR